jgi:hypothetical protein
MGPIDFQHVGREMRLQSANWRYPAQSHLVDTTDGVWNVLSHADAYGIGRLVRDLVSGDQHCHQLRDLLGGTGSTGVWRLSNEQVIDAVVEMVAARRLLVLEKSRRSDRNVTQSGTAAATAQHRSSEPASTPAQLMQRPSMADVQPAHEQPSAVEENFVASINQDAQAATLKAAAAHGVPFCEVCEKAKQARKAALDAQLATTA